MIVVPLALTNLQLPNIDLVTGSEDIRRMADRTKIDLEVPISQITVVTDRVGVRNMMHIYSFTTIIILPDAEWDMVSEYLLEFRPITWEKQQVKYVPCTSKILTGTLQQWWVLLHDQASPELIKNLANEVRQCLRSTKILEHIRRCLNEYSK